MFCKLGLFDENRPGVYPPALAVDFLGERIGIGRFELCQLPPFEHMAWHFV
jgi:hypothetical protein